MNFQKLSTKIKVSLELSLDEFMMHKVPKDSI